MPNVAKPGEQKAEKDNNEENKDKQEGDQEGKPNEENKQENKEANEEQKKNLINLEEFSKLSPEEQKKILDKRVATKKVRCKNWPSCKDPNCIFAHPTETVRIINFINLFNIPFLFFSVPISLYALMEINVVIFIQVFLVNLDIIAQELDVLILIHLDLILEWECIQI